MPRLNKRVRDSAISALLLTLVALGWLVGLKARDDQAKDERYQQQGARDFGGDDAWLSSLSR
ncbi:MAG: hypothetical protein WAM89_18320 [Terriglobales bacterium]